MPKQPHGAGFTLSHASFVYAWPETHCLPDDGAGCGAELEGGLTAGPLLLPGNPGTLAASWFRPSPESTAEPVVALGGFTAGPLLLPGCPGIPAPEFGLVGCCWLDCAFCAKAGVVTTNGNWSRARTRRVSKQVGQRPRFDSAAARMASLQPSGCLLSILVLVAALRLVRACAEKLGWNVSKARQGRQDRSRLRSIRSPAASAEKRP
jgi:hypothetical protein